MMVLEKKTKEQNRPATDAEVLKAIGKSHSISEDDTRRELMRRLERELGRAQLAGRDFGCRATYAFFNSLPVDVQYGVLEFLNSDTPLPTIVTQRPGVTYVTNCFYIKRLTHGETSFVLARHPNVVFHRPRPSVFPTEEARLQYEEEYNRLEASRGSVRDDRFNTPLSSSFEKVLMADKDGNLMPGKWAYAGTQAAIDSVRRELIHDVVFEERYVPNVVFGDFL
eukprot:TRINITY_DN8976_c0_g1_i3.p1 TRINITY_DN8976_c0_g1~~TRINITY_DN8976_c0_g1_i3.p1  ORF type:complete len:224 (+),score=48.45 TRINITY_DN8976_c0_g1_i3:818-1489(+)